MTGSQQSERRSQQIQAVEEAMYGRDIDFGEAQSVIAAEFADAVLAVPPAEPQEGEEGTPLARWRWVCDRIMERKEVIHELTGWSWVGPKAGEPALFEAFDKLAERPVQSSPDPVRAALQEVCDRAKNEKPWTGYIVPGTVVDKARAALRAVREPGPNVTEALTAEEARAIRMAILHPQTPSPVLESAEAKLRALEAAREGER